MHLLAFLDFKWKGNLIVNSEKYLLGTHFECQFSIFVKIWAILESQPWERWHKNHRIESCSGGGLKWIRVRKVFKWMNELRITCPIRKIVDSIPLWKIGSPSIRRLSKMHINWASIWLEYLNFLWHSHNFERQALLILYSSSTNATEKVNLIERGLQGGWKPQKCLLCKKGEGLRLNCGTVSACWHFLRYRKCYGVKKSSFSTSLTSKYIKTRRATRWFQLLFSISLDYDFIWRLFHYISIYNLLQISFIA